ncbi:putative penicillin-binding protein, transpeptidase superfamily protein [Gottschalkia acidurici 9a]|uniref:Penicillin-binding protein, transpeptidase superfamily protein n=1 Tax=Gottschalkia acidurici (strain ATCC 7906 / DSM 604 / BCRC 14475 / CIP 104303 / KCTC 5404 / NCIMB 10678 / 9a) TaxID=1128398 RepID=K0AXV6_GOTA9|nr:penicillin-binding transpeptidase domain-containing protein [Gottschalkia acidurici]AFS78024.1 putative penicillin-binding protein, transpeptidase superfamily protein [Gottschalkia acidurici 9a]
MKELFEKLKDRYSVLIFVLSITFFILSFRLASLTIISGDELREESNNKKLKHIPITAPRGEIRDRYGRLLAGNKATFTVQLIKDELNTKDKKERNEIILKLIHILEEEGVTYKDEFPIVFNSYIYRNENMYFEAEQTPTDKVVDAIIEHNLISELISSSAKYSNHQNIKDFTVGKKVINILENEGIKIPIDVVQNNNTVEFVYNENTNIDKWKQENGIQGNVDAKSAIIQIINNRNARKIVLKTINDPIISKIAYDIVDSKGLIPDIKLEPMIFSYDEQFKETKRSLMKTFKSITMESKAIDDFINILKESNRMSELFQKTYPQKDKEVTVVPGEVILNIFKENDIEMPIEVSSDKEGNKAIYKYKNEKEKKELLKKYKLKSDTSPMEAVMEIAQIEKTKVEDSKKKDKNSKKERISILEEFIKHDKIKGIAQTIVLKEHSNPRISISDWEYTPIVEKNAWIDKYKLDEKKDTEQIFNDLRKKSELDSKLTEYEARASLLILDEISKVGYQGYYPINIAYGISDKAVAKLEENKLELPGIKVSLEPVRYYPYGQTAAHILGYVGKIAQENEIEKYIKEKKYLPSTLIGKTGVEVQFEDYLKGKDGSKIVEADAHGNVVKVVEEKDAEPGDTLYLTIDADLQRIAEESLEKALREIRRGGTFESKWGNYNFSKAYPNAYAASVVATDVRTGEVLALANYPSYDPNLFATGISSEDWKSLNPKHDEYGLPLYNIAIQSPVQPGSIFKMVTGIAGMENGISPKKKIYDYGYVKVGNKKFPCLIWSRSGRTHGATDLYNALEQSCNYYFYAVALGRIPQTGEVLSKESGIDSILRVAKEFGLGEKTGVEIPGEYVSGVPDTESKTRSTKSSLKRFLKDNIDNYIKEDVKLSEKKIEAAIDEIASWAEYEDPLSKREVIKRLDKLGIDGERKIPESEKGEDLADRIKYTYLDQSGWRIGDTLNISIGQGQNAYTPIQMANYIAILSNGGYKHKMSVVDRIQTYDNTKKTYEPKKEVKRIDIKDYKYLEEAAKGMSMVAKKDGTASRAFGGFEVDVAAKTGTAEKDGISPVTKRKYDDFAWSTVYAPYEDYNPDAAQIAVSVVIFQGGGGGNTTPIAREIIAEYLGLNDDVEDSKFDLNSKLAK